MKTNLYPSLLAFFAFLFFASPLAASFPDGDENLSTSLQAAYQAWLNAKSAYLNARADSIDKALAYSAALADSSTKAAAYSTAFADSTSKADAYNTAKADTAAKAQAYNKAKLDSTSRAQGYAKAQIDSTYKEQGYAKAQTDSSSRAGGYAKAKTDSTTKAGAYLAVFGTYTAAKADSLAAATTHAKSIADSVALRQRIIQYHTSIYASASQALAALPDRDNILATLLSSDASQAAAINALEYRKITVNNAIDSTLKDVKTVIANIYNGSFIPNATAYTAKKIACESVAGGFTGGNTALAAAYRVFAHAYGFAASISTAGKDSIKSKGILIAADTVAKLPAKVVSYIPANVASRSEAVQAQSNAITAFNNFVAARDSFPPTAFHSFILPVQDIVNSAGLVFPAAFSAASSLPNLDNILVSLDPKSALPAITSLGYRDLTLQKALFALKDSVSAILNNLPALLQSPANSTAATAFNTKAAAYQKAADSLAAYAASISNKPDMISTYKASLVAAYAYNATAVSARAAYSAALRTPRDSAYLEAGDSLSAAVSLAVLTAQTAGSPAVNARADSFYTLLGRSALDYAGQQAVRAKQTALTAAVPLPASLAAYQAAISATVDSLNAYKASALATVDSLTALRTAVSATVDSLTALRTVALAAVDSFTALRTSLATFVSATKAYDTARDTLPKVLAAYHTAISAFASATTKYNAAIALAISTYASVQTAFEAYLAHGGTSIQPVVSPTYHLPAQIYTLTGIYVGSSTQTLPSGIYLIKRGDTLTKVLLKN
jgi:hypothetical protein